MADAEKIQSLRMTETQYARLAQYADDNSMSVSEALREILGTYSRGEVAPPQRRRRSRRVSIWMDPADWLRFTNRAANDHVTITDAIEAALEEHL